MGGKEVLIFYCLSYTMSLKFLLKWNLFFSTGIRSMLCWMYCCQRNLLLENYLWDKNLGYFTYFLAYSLLFFQFETLVRTPYCLQIIVSSEDIWSWIMWLGWACFTPRGQCQV